MGFSVSVCACTSHASCFHGPRALQSRAHARIRPSTAHAHLQLSSVRASYHANCPPTRIVRATSSYSYDYARWSSGALPIAVCGPSRERAIARRVVRRVSVPHSRLCAAPLPCRWPWAPGERGRGGRYGFTWGGSLSRSRAAVRYIISSNLSRDGV